MKAALVHKPLGLENLRFEETEISDPERGEIRVKLDRAGVNPIDYNMVAGKVLYNLNPFPHIPGAEATGIAQNDGKNIRKGDSVVVYPRLFCGNCDMCMNSKEYLCRNGGLWGAVSNGGYAEEFNIPEKNLFRIPGGIDPDVAVSLPVGGLTAYHALMRAEARSEKKLLIYGASGNTGLFAAQLASSLGLEVHGVSRKSWVKDFGVSEVHEPGKVPEGLRFDIIMNSIGEKFWKESLNHLSVGGSLVTFGIQTGKEGGVDIGHLYTGERSVIGSTGGSRKEFTDLMGLVSRKHIKVRVAKRFKLSDVKEALEYFPELRDGRIILEA